jgi:hypothetical protein
VLQKNLQCRVAFAPKQCHVGLFPHLLMYYKMYPGALYLRLNNLLVLLSLWSFAAHQNNNEFLSSPFSKCMVSRVRHCRQTSSLPENYEKKDIKIVMCLIVRVKLDNPFEIKLINITRIAMNSSLQHGSVQFPPLCCKDSSIPCSNSSFNNQQNPHHQRSNDSNIYCL